MTCKSNYCHSLNVSEFLRGELTTCDFTGDSRCNTTQAILLNETFSERGGRQCVTCHKTNLYLVVTLIGVLKDEIAWFIVAISQILPARTVSSFYFSTFCHSRLPTVFHRRHFTSDSSNFLFTRTRLKDSFFLDFPLIHSKEDIIKERQSSRILSGADAPFPLRNSPVQWRTCHTK